jgi:PhzF family phenazine biosynthesis protein
MNLRKVRFQQVDVFTAEPFKGNPLAVVFDADELRTEHMQAIANWTNLSETAFLCQPSGPEADYRVRIFTPSCELPFAGHPTLGAAHALLASGYRAKQAGRLIQECGAGLIEVTERGDGIWAFAAPSARITPLPESMHPALATALKTDAIDFHIAPCIAHNGVPWLVVRLRSAEDCLALAPDSAALSAIVSEMGMDGLAVYGPHTSGNAAAIEVRCLMLNNPPNNLLNNSLNSPTRNNPEPDNQGALGSPSFTEDPATGSANAAIAELLKRQDPRLTGYLARQGTALRRDARLHVSYDDATSRVWIGGHAVTIVDGTFMPNG